MGPGLAGRLSGFADFQPVIAPGDRTRAGQPARQPRLAHLAAALTRPRAAVGSVRNCVV
jgi:hypothetical protein